MDIIITPKKLNGTIRAVDSKSHAHRLLIAAAMAIAGADISCAGSFSDLADDMISDPSEDLTATAACMKTLLSCSRSSCPEDLPQFRCGESGSTLRFLLPLSVAAGRGGVFFGGGKLPERPLAPLDEELIRHGAVIERISSDEPSISTLSSSAKDDTARPARQKPICRISLPQGSSLRGGEYELPGHISSQYITGLLMALPLIPEDSVIRVTTPLQSRAYIDITLSVLKEFGIKVDITDGECPVYRISGRQQYSFPSGPSANGEDLPAGSPDAVAPDAFALNAVTPEGDWSNGAFWLAADALGSDITVTNLRPDSPQGDKAIAQIVDRFCGLPDTKCCGDQSDSEIAIDASEIPDLVPIISVLASLCPAHTRIVNAGRLRIKESDRLKTTCAMLQGLGADIRETEDGLDITGKETLAGGTISGAGDHRIVMAAAIAATCCRGPVTIEGAQAAAKSYPKFFEHYEMLGGSFEIK